MIGQLDWQLQRQVKPDPIALRLSTIPGAQTSFALLCLNGQIERFPRAKHLAS